MLQNLLKIKYPILLAPMAGVSTPELAAEVSNAGGLGSLGLGSSSINKAREQIQSLKKQTNLPFQVNFFCHESIDSNDDLEKNWMKYCCHQFQNLELIKQINSPFPCLYKSFKDGDDYLNLVIKEQVPIVSFHFGIPHAYQIDKLKQANIVTMASATNVSEALYIAASGIDIIIAQGIEAGGHRGTFNTHTDSSIKTIDLIHLIKKEITIPTIAAGGIMNSQHVQQCFKAGADAVQLGTAFVQCSTSNASKNYVDALFRHRETQITSSISGRPARGLINDWHRYIDHPNCPSPPPYPHAYYFAKELYKLTKDNKYEPYWAGMNVSEIERIEAKDLVQKLSHGIMCK
ncbi:NAD(P)H-dependent flavin oxidoreductase YrpB [Commensalibacter communis]|uniref:Propionate 3-nitronate monooxygenase n=1 Tax=Commensalibacter communis TaxID=2972786 RepID=A0A9W4X5N6_9PROT|nr:nitronate monooxygenase [Commensalibacter communis]CAI3922097.1 NAD(P)H-dependent flavin oxidoreductase YrpB [Commensalibacter communis]CAI3922252.1 NAD(P)H-dependent flavin oxidoreductase YrpB [Commensalibacter communis]CAI3932948.1 NAD(P)H-dependent flavin oxidoreductase YrpB [Commensalibacter communis]CAI3940724.1 NAD(P)H-dependent flavin oxidoreductase YrpB [Commensalibacter communis]CAI3941266.1 NAD(P)H-dependent flavin oxidoreductase YrpB [Commensalibacter communis]